MLELEHPPRVLCIGGTDPTGAAGLFQDHRTLASLGIYSAGVVTAVTVQTSNRVSDVLAMPASVVGAQIDAAVGFGVDAIKTGMLASLDTVLTVADRVRRLGSSCRLVIDPVLMSSSGRSLLDEEGRRALVRELIPLASLVTPNVAEAELLTGISVTTAEQRGAAADRFLAMGAGAVLIKGGHLPADLSGRGDDADDEVTDLLRTLDGDEYLIGRRRLGGPGFRGTGCCLAAAIAGFIAEGSTLRAAVESARDHLHRAMLGTLSSASPPMMQVPLELTHALRGAPLPNASDSGPIAFVGRPA